MAVGLEVRVPFCDLRLVEYVYHTAWSMKSFDGREKSLLRAATADVLPRSVVERAWLRQAADTEDVDLPVRFGLERALWLDLYKAGAQAVVATAGGLRLPVVQVCQGDHSWRPRGG
jgi:asparagine synthetase B (glutamine-hydrolysing)